MTSPRASYRIQFREGMTFDRASEIVAYLRRLGVSHVYASPIFRARPGSTHGYDVIDPAAIDPALGGLPALERLSTNLQSHGLGLIVDIVPEDFADHRFQSALTGHVVAAESGRLPVAQLMDLLPCALLLGSRDRLIPA